jgi:phosphoribosylformimino-5-aminoimidazole carboxamide ribotide isomerase
LLQKPNSVTSSQPVRQAGAVEKISEANGLKLIASGGISTFSELPKLAEMGCEGTIIGKAIYEHKISMKDIENYILNH